MNQLAQLIETYKKSVAQDRIVLNELEKEMQGHINKNDGAVPIESVNYRILLAERNNKVGIIAALDIVISDLEIILKHEK
jgi:hypothetical protein